VIVVYIKEDHMEDLPYCGEKHWGVSVLLEYYRRNVESWE
jgi:hypothetical protein